MKALEPYFQKYWTELPVEQRAPLERFYEAVLAENSVQNLTRLSEPEAFFFGHLWDVRELAGLGWAKGLKCLDLGSGPGVPGIPAHILHAGTWTLAESEGRKAEFLSKTVSALGLPSVRVVAGRAEAYLKKNRVDAVVTRAVGKIGKIYGWIRECSTWNQLVLFKGPAWAQEWEDFQKTPFGTELQVMDTHTYKVPLTEHTRVLVRLARD